MKKKLNPNNPKDRAYVNDIWDSFDEDDISTEQLIQMVADTCNIKYEDVLEFIIPTGNNNDSK